MKGSLAEGVLPGLLKELYVGRKTGLLHFTHGDERRSVRFRQGHVVHARSNISSERLGEVLVLQGLLSQADLERATHAVIRQGKRLGVVLQELGILDTDRIEDGLAMQVREVLLQVFSWTDGNYEFEQQDPAVLALDEDLTLKVSTGEMILEAVRRVEDPDVVRYALGDINQTLQLSTDPLLRFQKITLSPTDGYVLSRIDGNLSAREVIQLVPASVEDTQRSLFGLLCTGVVEYLPLSAKPRTSGAEMPRPVRTPVAAAAPTPRPAPAAPAASPPEPTARQAPAPVNTEARRAAEARRQEILEAYAGLKTRNHFEVLRIPRASSEAQVKEAYFKLAKRFHPDAHHDPELADLKDKLETVFIRLGEAYEVLRNARTRSSFESDLAARAPRHGPVPVLSPAGLGGAQRGEPPSEARLVEESLRKATRHIEEEKYWDAIQLLEAAVPKADGKMKVTARVLLARAYAKNPRWVKRAEEMLQNVVKEDPANVDAFMQLAAIYKGGNLKSRAVAMYRRVLEIKPDHEAAANELTALAPPPPSPEQESGGLLKKLFGKT